MNFIDAFREAVRKSGQSRYRIAQASGGRLHQSELSRFLSGRGNLGCRKLNIVAELVGLTVSTKRKTPSGVNLTGS